MSYPFKNSPYLGFGVPYSGKNNCGCTLNNYSGQESFLTELSDGFSIVQEETNPESKTHIQANINSTSGGNCALICVVQAPMEPII